MSRSIQPAAAVPLLRALQEVVLPPAGPSARGATSHAGRKLLRRQLLALFEAEPTGHPSSNELS